MTDDELIAAVNDIYNPVFDYEGVDETRGRKTVKENIGETNKTYRSPEEKEEYVPFVEHLLLQGLGDSEIARQTGLDRKAVAAMRKKSARPAERNAIGGVQRGWENERVNAEILRLANEGLSYVEVGEQVGLSWQTVRSRLTKQYKEYLGTQREIAAGRQIADLEVMRNELLDLAISIEEVDMADIMEDINEGEIEQAIRKVQEGAKKSQDNKFKAIEILLKIMDREAKLFGLDAASRVDINHSLQVAPEAIELLQRVKKTRELDNTIEADIVDDFDLGGGLQ